LAARLYSKNLNATGAISLFGDERALRDDGD